MRYIFAGVVSDSSGFLRGLDPTLLFMAAAEVDSKRSKKAGMSWLSAAASAQRSAHTPPRS